jgi:hypothetical protein
LTTQRAVRLNRLGGNYRIEQGFVEIESTQLLISQLDQLLAQDLDGLEFSFAGTFTWL